MIVDRRSCKYPLTSLYTKLNTDAPQSGDSPMIPLVEADHPPTEVRDRWKVVEKMEMITQYTFAGDYTSMLFRAFIFPYLMRVQLRLSINP